ncbi:MAG: HAMP domain-containing protein [Oscillospiraceae bacterium]|nr:HAMP domain-containing protein [Oscillospiraceae bacterium]
MKKILAVLAALLIAAWAVVLATDWGLPDLNQLSCTASGPDGAVYAVENGPFFSQIYGISPEGRLISLYQESSQQGTRAITQLAWSGSRLYFLRSSPGEEGAVLLEAMLLEENNPVLQGAMTLTGYRATGLTAPAYITGVASDGSGGVMVCNAADGSTVLIQEPTSQFRALSAVYLPEENGLRAVLDTGDLVHINASGGTYTAEETAVSLPRQLELSFANRLLCKAPLLLLATALVLALSLLAILVILLCTRAKRLAVRITAVSTGCILLALCLMAWTLLYQVTLTRLNDRLQETTHSAYQLSSTLSTLSPSSVLWGVFRGSDTQERYTGLLSAGAGNELYALREGELTVAVSVRAPFGVLVDRACSDAVAQLVHQAADGQTASALLTLQGRQTAVAAQPFFSNGMQVGVLLLRSDAGDIMSASLRSLQTLGLSGLVIFLAACVLLSLLLWRFTKPLGQLTRQMEAISDGDMKVRAIQTGLDEMGDLARAMQEMCMGLSIREYEVQSTIASYRRFVPRGLTDLLERASIMEVGFGDVRSITGNVGILSVSNRDTARNTLEDGPFVDFVDDCFGAANRSVSAHGGYLLSSGFDLGAVKVYYPGKASAAVASGLHLLGEIQKPAATQIAPDFFLLFHRTAFLYGIAGTQEEVFPFLSSQEMEFLGTYAAQFAGTGVRIVLTGSFLEDLDPGYTVRYIGYVNADNGESHKLYEVLDAYPDIERNLRVRYDARLQEAIQLFYRSDFYLARNLFSTLLRACPGDGIARWYLFACEHFFNAGAKEQPDCQLFGIDEV